MPNPTQMIRNSPRRIRLKLKSLMDLMPHENYLFLDSSMKIIYCSKNTSSLFNSVINKKLNRNTPFLEYFFKHKETVEHLHTFLNQNIHSEAIELSFCYDNLRINIRINKAYETNNHIGYSIFIYTKTDFINKRVDHTADLITEAKTTVTKNLKEYSLLLDKIAKSIGSKDETINTIRMNQKSGIDSFRSILTNLEDISQNYDPTLINLRIIPGFVLRYIRKVAIISNDATRRSRTKSMISEINNKITVFFFDDGKESLEFLQTNPADLVFLDVEMVDFDGWDFLRTGQALEINTPVVLVAETFTRSALEKIIHFKQIKGYIHTSPSLSDLKSIFGK